MHTIYDKITTASANLLNVVNVYYGRVTDPHINDISKNLFFLQQQENYIQFKSTLFTFIEYIITYKKKAMKTLEYITLNLYTSILLQPKGKYEIGKLVIHNNKKAYIVDYIHQLDLYEIQYTDVSVFGETYGWFRDTVLHSTN
jgi:hypothetical protein